MLGKLGQKRDCSFKVSNISVFSSKESNLLGSAKARITQIVFRQLGYILSAPLAFNIVSVKEGSLIYTVSWLLGALDVGADKEDQLVDTLCLSID